MNFKKNLKLKKSFEINLTPLIDVIFQLLIFFMLSSNFTQPSAINVKLPKASTADHVKEETITIVVTSENVIYWNDQVTTIEELRGLLSKKKNRSTPIFIKADRRSSVGRIVDIWDLGRSLGVERINIATEQ